MQEALPKYIKQQKEYKKREELGQDLFK